MEASISSVRSTGTLKTDFLPLFTTWRSHHHFSLGNSALFLRFFSLYFRFLSLFFSCFFLLHSLILASFSSFSLTIPLVKRTWSDFYRLLNLRKIIELEEPATLDNVAETPKTGKVTKLFSTRRWKDEGENGGANSRFHSAFGGICGETPFSIWRQHGKKRSDLVKSEYFGRF